MKRIVVITVLFTALSSLLIVVAHRITGSHKLKMGAYWHVNKFICVVCACDAV